MKAYTALYSNDAFRQAFHLQEIPFRGPTQQKLLNIGFSEARQEVFSREDFFLKS